MLCRFNSLYSLSSIYKKSVEVGAILQKRVRNLKKMLINLTNVTQLVSKQGQNHKIGLLIYICINTLYIWMVLTEGIIKWGT